MTDSLRHRGPDDVGFVELRSREGAICGSFGHRRLSILDLSTAGHQPMMWRDGRFSLTYNGEIYNYLELRAKLEQSGEWFRSTGDTEVLLGSWAVHGPNALANLRGMFALALWDRDLGKGYLARDAFGIKPLYVAETSGGVLFSSEIRSLLASGALNRRLSPNALASYLCTGSVAEPATIIDGVFAVPAGCYVEVTRSGDRVVVGQPIRFASPLDPTDEEPLGLAAAGSQLRDALRDSVRHHLLSDVPVALFLSGGLDSSAVVAVASEVSDRRLESFTITFAEAAYSEAAPAREVAEKFRTQHHEIPLSGHDLLNALPDVFAAMDQPSLDGLNTYVVSRAVKAYGIKVVLSGLGGDELFAGYPSFHRANYVAPLWKLPANVRRFGAAGASRLTDIRAEKVGVMLNNPSPALGAYTASRTLFGDRHVRALMGSAYPSPEDRDSTDSLEESRYSLLQQVSIYELSGYMRNTLLRDSDVFSMAHGLELRVPFVDREVVRAAARSADAAKLKRGFPKPLLAEAMRDLLPPALLGRPKQGFTLPFEQWMRRELFPEVDAVLGSSAVNSVGLSTHSMGAVWQDFQQRRSGMNWSRPWALYTLMRWAAQNGVYFDRAVATERIPITAAG
ncbi:MAG TPA: asparagine synthase (glutamine-hydrolyzing) [Gemmatimonadaceae bacterium]